MLAHRALAMNARRQYPYGCSASHNRKEFLHVVSNSLDRRGNLRRFRRAFSRANIFAGKPSKGICCHSLVSGGAADANRHGRFSSTRTGVTGLVGDTASYIRDAGVSAVDRTVERYDAIGSTDRNGARRSAENQATKLEFA